MSLVDTSINVANIITIIMVGGTAIATFVTMRNNMASMKDDMGEVKQKIEKLTDVLITVARQEERATASDQRAILHGKRLDELQITVGRIESGRFDALCDHLNRLIAVQQKLN